MRKQITDAAALLVGALLIASAEADHGLRKRRCDVNARSLWSVLRLSLAAGAVSCATVSAPPPAVVPYVDLARYVGTWYEIARLPNRFQKDCFGSTATYSLRPDGKVSVVNACRKGSPSGPLTSVEGVAKVVDGETHAKMKVTFFWPFWGDYWVVELGEAYDYAVVSGSDREYLWILSRTPEMEVERYQSLLARLRSRGFETDRLIRSPRESPAGR